MEYQPLYGANVVPQSAASGGTSLIPANVPPTTVTHHYSSKIETPAENLAYTATALNTYDASTYATHYTPAPGGGYHQNPKGYKHELPVATLLPNNVTTAVPQVSQSGFYDGPVMNSGSKLDSFMWIMTFIL
jgi:hypothetical protein